MANLNNSKIKEASQEKKKEIKEVKAKEKKLVKKLIFIVIAVFVVSALSLFLLEKAEQKSEIYEYVSTEQIDETYPSINPYPADFDKDLSGYNPQIMYVFTDGNIYSLEDIPAQAKNEAHRFFEKYFDILKNGDSHSYAELFTRSYKKDPKGFEKDFTKQFPPQQIYDIMVTELLRATDSSQTYKYEGKECFFGTYLVSYKIHENDGMFRRDLYLEHVERPLVFELVTFGKDTDKEETYIKNLYTESSIQNSNSKEN